MRRRLLSLGICLGLAGCSAAEPNYSGLYAGGDENGIIQLQIVETEGGNIRGSVSVSAPDQAAGIIKSTTKSVSGIRRGQQFSLVAHANEWGAPDAPFALEANGKTLVLNSPSTTQSVKLDAMSQSEYRARIAVLEKTLIGDDLDMVPSDL